MRKKYSYKGFNIDIDKMNFGYDICEIEKLANSRKSIKKIGEEIINLGRGLGLTIKWGVRGKVLEYLWRYDRKHYNKLKENKIIL